MRRRDWLPLAALTAAAAVLRFATIDVQSYWFDEALTAQLLRLPLGEMLGKLPDVQLTPPFYYVVAWVWAQVFGTTEVALRSFSAVLGIATVPLAYAVGRQFASGRAALALAALAAFNPLLVWYSQEARPYALWLLLGALTMLLWGRAQEDRTGRSLVLWAAVAVVALLTHYYAAFLIAPQGLWLLWIWRPRLHAAAALGVIGVVGAVLIPLAIHQNDRIGTGYITGLGLARRLFAVPEDFLTGFVVGFDRPVETVLGLIAGAVALAALVLAARRTDRRERRGALLSGALALATVGVPVLLAAGGIDYLNTRNMLIAWLPAMTVVAIGLAAGRRAGVAGVAVLCAVGVVTTVVLARDADYQRQDWRASSEVLGPVREPRIVLVPPLAGPVAITLYRDDLAAFPRAGAAVREIDVVAPYNRRVHAERPSAHPPPGFALAERRLRDDVTLLRYRADRPIRVTPEVAARVLPAATPLLERPGVKAPPPTGL